MTGEPTTTSKVRMVEIDEANATQRIDNFLISKLKGVPKSRIYRMIRKGEVRVNSKRAKAQYRLKMGDSVRIPPVRTASVSNPEAGARLIESRLSNRILYQDDDFLAINKPFGIAVHGGTGLSFGLIEGLRALRKNDRFLELVHRLDRDTSGCLLIARKRSMLRQLHESFRNNEVGKRYTALLSGAFPRKKVRVDQPLRKNIRKSGEWMVEIREDGKASSTDFLRIRKFSQSSLVEVSPKTGRTHQIRVHAAHLGFPLAGDERYGEDEFNRKMRVFGLKRLFLHASCLEFRHPRDGRKMRIEAPLDPELTSVLERLQDDQGF